MSFLLDRKLKNKGKKTSKTGWTFLTIQRFVISLCYIACLRVKGHEVLHIRFSQITCKCTQMYLAGVTVVNNLW